MKRKMSKTLRKPLSLFMVFLMTMGTVIPAYADGAPADPATPAPAAQAAPVTGHIQINQIYGNGGNTGAKYTNDFIELYNPTKEDVNLTGWSIQYAAKDSSNKAYNVNPIKANATIKSGKCFLVKLAGGTTGEALPKEDDIGTSNLSGTAGKVALVSNSTAIKKFNDAGVVDFVGYGVDANESEGKQPTVTPQSDDDTPIVIAVIRKTLGVDTDNNLNDFMKADPNPQNSASVPVSPPAETKCAKPKSNKPATLVDPGTVVTFSSSTVGATLEYNMVSATNDTWTAGNSVTVNAATTYYVRVKKEGLSNSDVVTFAYDVKDPNKVFNTKEFLDLPKGTENVTVKGTLAYIATTSSNPVIYSVVDGQTHALYIFGKIPTGAKIGDVIKFNGIVDNFGGMPQLKAAGTPSVEAETGVSVTPQEMSITDILAKGNKMLGQIVKIKDITLGTYSSDKSTPITDKDGNAVNIFKASPYPIQVVAGDTVDLTAMIAINNGTLQLYTGTALANGFNTYDVKNDTKPPVVTMNDMVNAKPGVDYKITVKAEDNKGVKDVLLTYTLGAKTVNNQTMKFSQVTNDYSFVIPASEIEMDDETLSFKVQATDVTGLKTETLLKTVLVDGRPQFVKVAPARGFITGAEKSPKISVTLSNAGTKPEVLMTLKSDNTPELANKVMEAGTEPNTFEYSTSNLPDGQYSVSVSVKRTDGISNTQTWNFIVGTPKERAFFGQLHAHTAEYSDGSGKLSDGLNYIKSLQATEKVDFVAFTDHSNYFDTTAAANPAEAMNDPSKMTTESASKWNTYVSSMRTFNDSNAGTILAFPGYEMTWSGGPGHINTFNSKGIVSRNNKGLNDKAADAGLRAYYAELIKNTDELGNLSQFNHPGTTFGTFADFSYWSPEIDKKMVAVEVGNGEGAIGSGGYFPSYSEYTKALDKGWHVAPTNNQDNHKGNWGNANTGRTVITTTDLSENGLLKGLKNRATYATEDKNMNIQYLVNNKIQGTVIAEVPTTPLQFKVVVDDSDSDDVISKIDIVTNSGRVATTKSFDSNSVEWNFELPATQGYYYVRVTQADKNIAVTAPVWIGQAPRIGISSFECNAPMPVTGEKLTLSTTLFNNEATSVTVKSIEIASGTTILGTNNTKSNIDKAGTLTVPLEYTPVTPGVKKVTLTVVMTIGVNEKEIQEKIFTKDIELNVRDSNKMVNIGIDASHFNEYVQGNYKDSMGNFAKLAANYDVHVVELNTSEALIAATQNSKYKMLILTPPTRRNGIEFLVGYKNYTDAEIAAIKAFAESGKTVVVAGWSDTYEAYTQFTDQKPYTLPAVDHMSNQQNKLLTALGSTLRIADDEIQDPIINGGQAQRLYLSNYNLSNPFIKGVKPSEQVYSNYGGSSIYVVDRDNKTTEEIPSTVSPMVYGFVSSISKDTDKDGVLGALSPSGAGAVVPKYSNKLMVAASENIKYGNGKTGTVVVAGSGFMSNFEIQAALDNQFTPAYSNYTIMENIVQAVNPIEITNISKVHAASEGETFTIEGIVTSNASGFDKNTAFFDTVYIQDATAGIDIFPVSGSFKAGQKVQVSGTTSSYCGERQLNVKKITLIDPNVNPLPTPVKLSTEEASKGSRLGSLVTLTGIIQKLTYKEGVIESIYIADNTYETTRVFIDGYITSTKAIDNLKVGAELTVVGLSSIDTEGPRARVRDRGDVVCSIVPDKTGPQIKLIGQKDMNVTLNSVFKDPGATALDLIDGILTSKIKVTGTVDTKKLGEQVITYTVADAAGNVTTVKRTVTVSKEAKPEKEDAEDKKPVTPPVVTVPTAPKQTSTDPDKKNSKDIIKDLKEMTTDNPKSLTDKKTIDTKLKALSDSLVDSKAVQATVVEEKTSMKFNSDGIAKVITTIKADAKAVETETKLQKPLKLAIPVAVEQTKVLTLDKAVVSTLKAQGVDLEIKNNLGKIVLDDAKIKSETLNVQLTDAPKRDVAVTNGKAVIAPIEIKLTADDKPVAQAVQVVLPTAQIAQPNKTMLMKLDPVTNTWTKVKSVVTDEGIKANVDGGVYTLVEKTNTSFKDVNNQHWASNVISVLETRGVMNGVSDTQFKPEDKITKAEFLAAVLNNFGIEASSTNGKWYADYLVEAQKLGINVVSDKDADKAITREEMALIIAKAYKSFESTVPQAAATGFKDVKNVSGESQEAIALVKSLGIVGGYSDGSYKPADNGTRAEAAQMLFKLMSASN